MVVVVWMVGFLWVVGFMWWVIGACGGCGMDGEFFLVGGWVCVVVSGCSYCFQE